MDTICRPSIESREVFSVLAMIMAGGEGERLRPLTCTLPKPMTLVLDQPVLA